MNFFIDRLHRLPRIWSNRQLAKYAHLFHGDVVNVSGWKDIDKEGKNYKDYFSNAKSYTITNFKSNARGFQGFENEIFLDLEKDLPDSLIKKYDVVFNHTTLEHIYNVKTAFKNLCNMSKDIVIIILPFLQPYHSTYGDYWRFSPLVINKIFEENSFKLLFQSFNKDLMSSVYTFTIATRKKNYEKWKKYFNWSYNSIDDLNHINSETYIGYYAIPNYRYKLYIYFNRIIKSFLKYLIKKS